MPLSHPRTVRSRHASPLAGAPSLGHRSDADGAPVVLVVDDFADAREMYGLHLRLHGYRVLEAVNGLDACEKACASGVAVVLMDLAMPVRDGYTATRQIKATRPDVRIVVLTADDAHEAHRRAWEAGCDSLLTKPCLPSVLTREIGRLLGRAA